MGSRTVPLWPVESVRPREEALGRITGESSDIGIFLRTNGDCSILEAVVDKVPNPRLKNVQVVFDPTIRHGLLKVVEKGNCGGQGK